MNPAMWSVVGGLIASLVPVLVIIITRFSDRKKDRAAIASTDAVTNKTFQEIASIAANQAEERRVQMVEIRKLFRSVRDMFEDICMPIIERERPELAETARDDLAKLDRLL